MSFGYAVLGFGSLGGSRDITINITSNASDQSILTLANALGYNAATDTTKITVNVASGVTLSGSSASAFALRTGSLNVGSVLEINVSGNLCGFTGANGSAGGNGAAGSAGGAGGAALNLDYNPSGGSITVTVNSGGVVGGGSGGGGGGGGGGARRLGNHDTKDGSLQCVGATQAFGSAGSAGSAGTACRAAAGASGSAGNYGAGNASCNVTSPGAGGAGGAAGAAIAEAVTVTYTLTNSGNVYGSVA
tara:strand:- start:899 stop:1639 length:741 start_codon:yes stop_codon:yes gene_type:complete